ncbi:MAG: maltose alpha-D-glucosyltransferase [Ignavibacteria bacterium]|jgi:maltose alpha-D-glucosyltransferase/alpha-amylase|nr:maltose alpha-D-glucosyltransferase [Ignavibacteria bacterium]MCU7503587.1 maltose alpha-D-glucosyltransferase [Ignavibacteria bacterium]MCU7516759.1 maltose alpha-D-glucosyltransferase [Ignavibacteria bacterium]
MAADGKFLDDNPLWYKDGIIYQVHVKAYRDSNNDGIGDFRGLLEKLDYIENLGVTTIWLLPFYPSPLKDDGYDIADYYNIHSQYGILEDFKDFLKEAHRRGIRVITELVLNHTSDQHRWFQLARISKPGSVQRDYYVWSDTPEKYKDARIIFGDFETSNWSWDPVAHAYYWHRFYAHQPDLNFDNPHVHKALFRVVDFWFEMGVDGLRLDAVPYLFEREGTNCENLPETHEFLKSLNTYVKKRFKNKMLLAEANQWPEDAVEYFGNEDECQMAFHFPLMPRLFMSLQMEDRFPIIDILEQTPAIPESCQWAMFLRNHDELTLEMVTDEERDYMYRFYAKDNRARINLGIRRRLAPLVENNRRKIELLNILLFSFPGTPIIYYGDEIGMGDNYYLGDRNGVRTPMQWSPDRNAGFSDANPQKLFLPVIIDPEYHYEAVNVEVQERSSSSLLWWMKRAIAVRKSHKAFGRGTLEFLAPANPKVLAFVRKYESEVILVVVNLSRFPQVAELEISKYQGFTPVEAFSRNKFPGITESSYMLTLNPYDYYWFILKKEESVASPEGRKIPEISVKGRWKNILKGEMRSIFEDTVLSAYIKQCEWFEGDRLTIQEVRIEEEIHIPEVSGDEVLLIVKVSYLDRGPELYLLPISAASDEKARKISQAFPEAAIACLKDETQVHTLYDGIYDENFRQEFLKMLIRRRNIKGEKGEMRASIEKRIKSVFSGGRVYTSSQVQRIDKRNINLLYADTLTVKLYRKLDEGVNPGLEILNLLTSRSDFANIPPYGGGIMYFRSNLPPIVLGVLKEYVISQSDGWSYVIDIVKKHFDNVLALQSENAGGLPQISSFLSDLDQLKDSSYFGEIVERINMEMVGLLGKRTGEMHLALYSLRDDPAFSPEPFSMLYQRSIYQSVRSLIRSTYRLLNRNISLMPEDLRKESSEMIGYEQPLLSFIAKILTGKLPAQKIRIHGDYHLGQVLFTGKDFVITNFEGPANQSVSERKLKRSPLRDAAGMIWSFHYAAYTALLEYKSSRSEDISVLEAFAEQWWLWMGSAFMQSYYDAVQQTGLLPPDKEELEYMLHVYLLEKKFNELHYALSKNIDDAYIPIKGIKYFSKFFLKEGKHESVLKT